MTQQEYFNKIVRLLTTKEGALINFNIFYNDQHHDFYMDYKMGSYEKCYKYLKKHRHLLTLEHTPERYKEQAKRNIINAKLLKGQPTVRINFE